MKRKLSLHLTLAFMMIANLTFAQVASPYYGIFHENELISEENTLSSSTTSIWNGFTATAGSPFLGDTAFTLLADTTTWNGIGIKSDASIDLSSFIDGYLKVALKTSTTEKDFRVGIKDASNGDWVVYFNSDSDPYGFERNGEWQELSIPIADFELKTDASQTISVTELSQMSMMFYIVGTVDIAIDEVYYSATTTGPLPQIESSFYGIYHENNLIDETLSEGSTDIWNGFTAIAGTPFSGDTAITLEANTTTWNGIGIKSNTPIGLSNFMDGYLKVALKTNTTDKDFRIGIKDADNGDWVVYFNSGSDPYGFERNGEWQELSIPIADFELKTDASQTISVIELSQMTMLFYIVGTVDIAIDEIYYSKTIEGTGTEAISKVTFITEDKSRDSLYIDLLSKNNCEVNVVDDLAGVVPSDSAMEVLEASDVILVSRNTNSSGYDATSYHSLATPIMQMSGYMARSTRWQLLDNASIVTDTALVDVLKVEHAIFENVSQVTPTTIAINNSLKIDMCSIDTASNASIIASSTTNGYITIAEWEKNTTFYEGSDYSALGHRMAFFLSNDYDLTVEGEKMFVNAVKYLTTFDYDTTILNVAPSDIILSNASIDENEEIGTKIGAFTAVDENLNESWTYSLVSGEGDTDNGEFSVEGANLLAAAIFDFETKDSYSIRVNVEDKGGLTFEKVFTISINDVVESSVDDFSNSKVLIYPNPSVDVIFIDCLRNEKALVSIFNLNGQIVFQKSVSLNGIVEIQPQISQGYYIMNINSKTINHNSEIIIK